MQQLMFKLDQNPNGRGLRCDGDGLFLGRNPLLRKNDEGNFEARPDVELQKTLSGVYGGEANWESHIRSVKLVANALNKDDMARAMMTAVLMRLSDPGTPARTADTNGALAKAGYDPDEPRDERGRWTNGGDGNATPHTAHRDPRIQLADDAISDAPNDAVAEAVARAAAAQRDSCDVHSQVKPVDSKPENFWQTISSGLSHEAQSVISEIGHGETVRSNASLAGATAGTHAIAEGFEAYNRLMHHLTGGVVPLNMQYPLSLTSDGKIQVLTRPATVSDETGPLFTTAAMMFPGAEAAELTELEIAAEPEAFIALPKELPKNFDIRLPVGRYKIPETAAPGTTTYGDLVGKQIGDLFQSRQPNVPMTLRTSPGMRGVDIEVAEPYVDALGARYLEIKPLTDSGFRTFRVQIVRWKLTEPVLPVTYDYEGNIYYGFPK
jgi:hypothetical protein